MKRIKKLNMFLSALLVVTVLLGGTMPAQAASAEVGIEIKATDVNVAVTVPSQVPIVFNEDGTNTYPENWTVTNESKIAGVYLLQVIFTPTSDWEFLSLGEHAKDLPANTKKVRFFVGTEEHMNEAHVAAGLAGATFYNSDIRLPASTSKEIKFEVERGAFTQGVDMHKAFDMELDFSFI